MPSRAHGLDNWINQQAAEMGAFGVGVDGPDADGAVSLAESEDLPALVAGGEQVLGRPKVRESRAREQRSVLSVDNPGGSLLGVVQACGRQAVGGWSRLPRPETTVAAARGAIADARLPARPTALTAAQSDGRSGQAKC